MKRRMLALFLALFLGIALTGCADVQSNNGPYKMYLIAKSTTTEFWKSVFAGANAAKSEYNVDLTILGPETEEDYEEQNRLIDEAVAAGADAIVYSAISYTKNAEAITRAAKQGLKIAVIDSDVDSDGVGVRIGTDNVEAGRMAGRAALQTDWDSLTGFGILPADVATVAGPALFPRIDVEKELAALEELNKPPVPALQIEPYSEEKVDFDTFCKSDLRAVKVKDCQPVKKSDKLLCFTLDDGTGTDRQILSGIAKYYKPEELVGKTLVAIVNLPPRKMMGRESNGMLISAEQGESLHLLMLDDAIPAGAKLC